MIMIQNIAVVDDTATNREAATKAIAEVLPSAVVHLFSSAKEIITALNSGSPTIDLILADMNMEDKTAGYRVACEAWAWNIPATIISGGHKTHTTDQVHVGYPSAQFYGEKDDQRIWKQILAVVLKGDRTNNAILTALATGKRKVPDYEYGRTCAVVVVPRFAMI